jgi:hypothetical protein
VPGRIRSSEKKIYYHNWNRIRDLPACSIALLSNLLIKVTERPLEIQDVGGCTILKWILER